MATFTKRENTRWPVRCKGSPLRSFASVEEAKAYVSALPPAAQTKAKIAEYQSAAWQVRVRSALLARHLTKTFETKKQAVTWAQEKEGEIVKRQFVDYSMADRTTLGDLLRKYDERILVKQKKLDRAHPDRSRVRSLCKHPIASMKMSLLRNTDFSAYRDERLGLALDGKQAGSEVVHASQGSKDALPVEPSAVKGSTVNKELELMSRVIALARREWKLHLPLNPASGELAKRVALTEADERDRRLQSAVSRECLSAARDRRKSPDEEFEVDPVTQELLAMPQSEYQLLLRSLRYPHWFRPRKKNVTAVTLRARQKATPLAVVKARNRAGGRSWAPVSFAIEAAMRRKEMTQLKWCHVHTEHGNGYLELPGELTKNRQSRMVPLTLRAKRILQTQPHGSEYVFATTVDAIKSAYRRARARVQIEDLRLHDLRHEATSRLFERTDLRETEIGSITGHTDPRMLKRYYNKRPEEFVRRFQQSFKST